MVEFARDSVYDVYDTYDKYSAAFIKQIETQPYNSTDHYSYNDGVVDTLVRYAEGSTLEKRIAAMIGGGQLPASATVDDFVVKNPTHNDDRYTAYYIPDQYKDPLLTGQNVLATEEQYNDAYSTYMDTRSAYEASVLEQEQLLTDQMSYQDSLITESTDAYNAEVAAMQNEYKATRMNDMLSVRDTASNAAIDYVNTQIANEQSNASLFGVEYNTSDEITNARIERKFSEMWSEDNDTELGSLFEEIGVPEGVDPYFDVKVGEGSILTSPDANAGREVVSSSKGVGGATGMTILTGDGSDDNEIVESGTESTILGE